MTSEDKQTIHVGSIIKKYIDANHIFKSALTRSLGVNPSVVLGYQKRASVNTSTLINLSQALQHNFFADIAALLPNTFSTTVPIDKAKDEKIAALELEITILNAEKKVLLEAFGG